MTVDLVVQLISSLGVPTALLVTVLWFIKAWITNFMADAKERELRMVARIDQLEDFQKHTLLTLLGETKTALRATTDCMREMHTAVMVNNESVKELLTRMLERPCLLPHDN